MAPARPPLRIGAPAGQQRGVDGHGPAGRDPGLVVLGLDVGDRVRFRRRPTSRWTEGRVVGRERDGSVGIADPRGAARALPVTAIEVRAVGPRGGAIWESVAERALRSEQLELF